ncbi:cytochrome b5 [Eutrema salsugineum]|uniref:cytochrome b5 n=1 Tax=Eutrema salsugineum TaxID=72664 RepID=UPI000CED3C8F|nr:cytochrome b5 [Eutrema salsugineum]
MAGDGKVLDLSELSQHRSRQDCWLLINGKVYDVTKFLDDHPGGVDVLLSASGKDATDEFEEVGHSSSAKFLLDEFYVGDIDSIHSTKAKDSSTTTYSNQTEQNQANKNSELLLTKFFQYLAPLLVLGLALYVLLLHEN